MTILLVEAAGPASAPSGRRRQGSPQPLLAPVMRVRVYLCVRVCACVCVVSKAFSPKWPGVWVVSSCSSPHCTPLFSSPFSEVVEAQPQAGNQSQSELPPVGVQGAGDQRGRRGLVRRGAWPPVSAGGPFGPGVPLARLEGVNRPGRGSSPAPSAAPRGEGPAPRSAPRGVGLAWVEMGGLLRVFRPALPART